MYDEYGTSYLLFPDSGIPAANYYKKLQTECDAGQHQELLTPLGAAAEFVQSSKWFDGKPAKNSFVFTNELENKYIVENQTSLDKGTQRKTTENELPSLTQCTA